MRVPILSFLYLLLSFQLVFAQDANALKSEIYSKLKCCDCQVTFDKCVCPEAKEMKGYIDALIEARTTKEEIFYKVAKKYSLNVILDEQIKDSIEQRLIKEAGQKRPQIVLEPASFDFGEVTKKQGKISKIFKLSNQGNAPLVIKNIRTSCPCTFVSLKVNKKKSPPSSTEGSPANWQAEVKPGENAELEVVLDLASPHVSPGKVIRDTSITSNDPIYPQTTVRIEAEVKD